MEYTQPIIPTVDPIAVKTATVERKTTFNGSSKKSFELTCSAFGTEKVAFIATCIVSVAGVAVVKMAVVISTFNVESTVDGVIRVFNGMLVVVACVANIMFVSMAGDVLLVVDDVLTVVVHEVDAVVDSVVDNMLVVVAHVVDRVVVIVIDGDTLVVGVGFIVAVCSVDGMVFNSTNGIVNHEDFGVILNVVSVVDDAAPVVDDAYVVTSSLVDPVVDGVVLVVVVCLVVAGLLFFEFVINFMILVVALVVDVVFNEVNGSVYGVVGGLVVVVFDEVNDMIFVVVLIDCGVCLVVCVIVDEGDGVVLVVDCEVDAEVVAVCKLVKCVAIEGVIDNVVVSVVVWSADPVPPCALSQSLFFLPPACWKLQLSPRLLLS